MEKLDAAVKKMASKPAAVATFTLLTALLPWVITFTPPLLRSLEVGFATEAWRLVVAWLTTPVLFVLVNFVILSIWATSSTAAAAREGAAQGDLASVAAAAAATAVPPPPKRKLDVTQTLVFLPPVSVVKSDPQISVFSRSMMPLPSVREIFDPEPEQEPLPLPVEKEKGDGEEKEKGREKEVAREPPKMVVETTVAAARAPAPAPTQARAPAPAPAPTQARAPSPGAPIGILPPPLPSFLVGHEKLRKSASSGAPRKKKVVRTRSDGSGVVIKDMSSMEVPDDLTLRVEALIATVRAQLRQE